MGNLCLGHRCGNWSLIHTLERHHAVNGVALWNCAMHFVVLEILVLLLGRIRIETVSRSSNA